MTLCVGLAMCLVAAFVGTAAGEEFPQCDGRTKGDYIPGTKGCRSFIFCSGDYSYEDSCPIGLYFNPESGMCDDPANVPCQDDEPKNSKVMPKPEDNTNLLPNPEQPTDIPKRTPPGPTEKTTTPVQNLPAERPLPPTKAQPGSIPTTVRPEEPVYTSNPPTTLVPVTTTLRPTTTPWPNTNTTPSFELDVLKERCSRVMGGYFPYPDDCRHFFRCTEGKLIKQECAAGYGWDAQLKMCTTSGCSPKDAPIMNKN